MEEKPHDDWHVVKAVARGFSRAWGEFTGDPESEIQARNKMLGVEGKGDKAAEFIGGMVMPTPMPEAATWAASRAADATKRTAGQLLDSDFLKYIERSLARLPGGDFLRRAVKNQNEQLGNKSADLVERLSGGADTSRTGVGKTIDAQVKSAVDRMKIEAGADYDVVDALIDPSTKIGVKRTLQTLRDLTEPTAGAEHATRPLIDSTLKQMRLGLEKDLAAQSMDAMPYEAAKALRTKLRGMIDWTHFTTDPKNGQLKQVYHALTADMSTGAAEINPAAAAAVMKANAAYTVNMKLQETLDRAVGSVGGPERFFESLMNGSAHYDTAVQVVSQLDEPSKRILAAGILERMGKAVPSVQGAEGGAFSAATFLTNWNKMSRNSPQLRDLVFGSLPGEYSKNITQLAANVEVLKSYEGILSNPAGTAHAALWGGTVGTTMLALMSGRFDEAGKIGAGAGGIAAVSAALTNPRTAAWLAAQTAKLVISAAKGEMGTKEKPMSNEYERAAILGHTTLGEGVEEYERGVGEALGQME